MSFLVESLGSVYHLVLKTLVELHSVKRVVAGRNRAAEWAVGVRNVHATPTSR